MAFLSFYVLFFFFKQKTAYEMRISDWSSDVCSSDLLGLGVGGLDDASSLAFAPNTHDFLRRLLSCLPVGRPPRILTSDGEFHSFTRQAARLEEEIGRAHV